MRNKKLISMLMLSAGFAACTQDELVDTPNVNNVDQKDLVEDVILNVSFEEDAITRAAYAGGATEVDPVTNERNAYEVFQNFYLEPAWTSAEKNAFTVSNQEALAGDMIGFCLNLNGNAITNYPFYIAGYNTADQVTETENGDGTVTTSTTKKVWGLAEQSGLYDLGVDAGIFEKATAADIKTSISAVGKILRGEDGKWGDHTPLELDVRKGIVRTNSGIMTGSYIAYFPYNDEFTDPAAIPAKGKEALKGIYTADLADDRETALQNVGFYDYLFANAREAVTVQGGTKAGDAKIVPQTSALTFAFTNSSTESVSTAIKRITVKAATEGDEPFILKGSVSLDNLNAVKAETTTDLIGVGFEPCSLSVAIAATEGTEADQDWKYVTIPYMANPTDGKYIVEIYNNNGEIATIEWTTDLGLGKAKLVKIDLAEKTFEPGVRKIFTMDEFEEEVVAGGQLELMIPITVENENLTVGASDEPVNLEILGKNPLILLAGTYYGNITHNEGQVTVGNATGELTTTVDGNVTADKVNWCLNGQINGNIKGHSYVSVNRPTDFEQTHEYAITGKSVELKNGTYTNVTATGLGMTIYGNVSLDYNYDTEQGVTSNGVIIVSPDATLNVANATTKTLENWGTTNLRVLYAETVNNKAGFFEGNEEAGWKVGTINQTYSHPETEGCVWNNEGTVNWNESASAIEHTIYNSGTLNIEIPTTLAGSVVNTGTVKMNDAVTVTKNGIDLKSGNIYVNSTLNFAGGTVDVAGGTLRVNQNGVLSGKASGLLSSGGDIECVTNASNFSTDITGSTTYFAAKYTKVVVTEDLRVNSFKQNVPVLKLENATLTVNSSYAATMKTLETVGTSGFSSTMVSTAENLDNYGELTITGRMNITGTLNNYETCDVTGAVVNCETLGNIGTWVNSKMPNSAN